MCRLVEDCQLAVCLRCFHQQQDPLYVNYLFFLTMGVYLYVFVHHTFCIQIVMSNLLSVLTIVFISILCTQIGAIKVTCSICSCLGDIL